jgi:xylulokinase
MAKLLGIDVGTSGCRALVMDESGVILKEATSEYAPSIPRPGWSEQDPHDWWNGIQTCLAKLDEPNPDAIGLTGQMHGSVFLDAAGEVLRPAILWNDQRTIAECQFIEESVGHGRVREITRNPPLTGFQLPKVVWLRRNEPEVFGRVRKVLLPKDYIRFKLSGQFVSDVSDASGTGNFDVARRNWSPEIAGALDLPESLFPDVRESFEVSAKSVAHPFLSEGVAIVAGAGDQAAGAIGTGTVEPGIFSISLGTSGVVFTALDGASFDPNGSVHTFCHANGAWHAMGVMLSCGGAVKWLRDQIGGGRSYEELTGMAAKVQPGSDGVSFLPYLTGERTPHNDPAARACWAGLAQEHGLANMARAVYEGATFGLLDCYDSLKMVGAGADDVRITGGGARSSFWVQMIADAFQKTCTLLETEEGPAHGAAILGGVGIGLWPSVSEACRQVVKKRAEILPSGADYAKAVSRYRELYQCQRKWNLG